MSAQKRNYGTDSIKPSAQLRTGRPCLVKYHLTGCLREVVGFFEKMAVLDSDRFVFVRKMETLQDNAVKNWKTKEPYGDRQIRRALAQAEELGILTFDIKDREGEKAGYVVAQHDKIAFSWVKGKRCSLTVQYDKNLRKPAKPKHQKRPKPSVCVTSCVTSFPDCVTSSEACVTSRVTSSEDSGDIIGDIILEQEVTNKSDSYKAQSGDSAFLSADASLYEPSLASKESLIEPSTAGLKKQKQPQHQTPSPSLSNPNQHQNQNIGQGKTNPEYTVAELYEFLEPPEPPWSYYEKNIITLAECHLMVDLRKRDYAQHDEFYTFMDADKQNKAETSVAGANNAN